MEKHVTDCNPHTKNGRDEWLWDSPVLARVGKARGRVNVFSVVDPLAYFFQIEHREVYGVTVEDVQIFIEKRLNVFNFHLLDESLDIPDPKAVLSSYSSRNVEVTITGNVEVTDVPPRGGSACGMPPSPPCLETNLSYDGSDHNTAPIIPPPHRSASNEAEKKANDIVTSMLDAVSNIGQAANQGGKQAFQEAVSCSKKAIVDKLKQFQSAGPEKNVQVIAKESMDVIKQMHKAVGKNVTKIKQHVDSITKPPPKRTDWKPPRLDVIRIGYIVGKDLRIFSKDIILRTGANTKDAADASAPQRLPYVTAAPGKLRPPNAEGWSKPILLKEITFTASELAPPLSLRDNGKPAIGMTPDKYLDVLMKKIFHEMAKTNSGRVLETALSEVFNWMKYTGFERS